MKITQPKYITDEEGKKIAVILPIEEYERLIEALEDQDDVRLYDEAKASDGPYIPMNEAFEIIERNRRNRENDLQRQNQQKSS